MQKLNEGKPYQVMLNDNSHFVGYYLAGLRVLIFRNGLNDKIIVLDSDIKQIKELSPREIETRKTTGKFFIY
jgi:hypothetical protein